MSASPPPVLALPSAAPSARSDAGRELRVWAITELPLEGAHTGGSATMRRHFRRRSVGQTVWSVSEDALALRGGGIGAAFRRARYTRFGPAMGRLQPFWDKLPARVDRDAEPREAMGGPADVIFTVAHGTAWMTALRVARALDRPLVTVFHDWFPDQTGTSVPLRAVWDRAFRQLSQASAMTLCVSEGMREELGPHPDARVLAPIPADPPPPPPARVREPGAPVRLFYAGMCGGHYKQPMGGLIAAVRADERFELDLCGVDTEWMPKDVGPRVRIHGDVPPSRRQELAAAADVALVLLPFEAHHARHLRTHFPSKLIEYCGLGRPLAVWGPPYASAIRWANETAAATPVTENDPAVLLATVADGVGNGSVARSAAAAAELSRTTFHPDVIHDRLLDALHEAAGVPRPAAVNGDRVAA